MVTAVAFTVFVLAVFAQRLFELRKSRANEKLLRERGAKEHASKHFRWMQLVHGGWLVGSVVEVWVREPRTSPVLLLFGLLAFTAGQLLRLSAMRALGERWTVRILTLPGEPPVTRGIYRYLRHPNYLGVILEIAALPLAAGAFISAVVFSLLNLVVLAIRIREEEQALAAANDYFRHFGTRPRFVPHPRTSA